MDTNAEKLETCMEVEHARTTAEREYLRNPTDSDNLIRWGASLLLLSKYGTNDDSRKMLREGMSKLEEALTINPVKHEALWCMGYAHVTNGRLTSNSDEAKIMFDEAVQCFQKAVDESPDNEDYRKSLAECAKARALHREIYGGPAATSKATGSAKLKNDLCGWVILAVGLLAWIVMVILLMDRN